MTELERTWNERRLRIEELEAENKELKNKVEELENKNKWHFVKDGDVPKTNEDVLVYSGEQWRMCVGRYFPKYKCWEAGCDTVAWKYIETLEK